MVFGVWMSGIGERIASSTSLSHTFVGATLLALVTSFPEIAVTVGAMRAGSADMALGNIFGSNLFDLSILPVLDAFTKAPITGGFTSGQITVTAMAVFVPAVIMWGMKRQGRARCKVGLDSVIVFVTGIAALVLLFFVE
jgi:cation:H+ antiporter